MTVDEAIEAYKEADEDVAQYRSRLAQAKAGYDHAVTVRDKAAETLRTLLAPSPAGSGPSESVPGE